MRSTRHGVSLGGCLFGERRIVWAAWAAWEQRDRANVGRAETRSVFALNVRA
jgi:hypothetical protein